MPEKEDKYVKGLKERSATTDAYYRKSIVKTEQQKFLEELLLKSGRKFTNIADIACGGGTLSFHLRKLFPEAKFTLSDFNDDAIKIAREINGEEHRYLQGNIYDLKDLKNDEFDLVCCWQTLSWLDKPKEALNELIRITKPGGKIYLSSLFNIHHDVDIYANLSDRSRSDGEVPSFAYNTYSGKTVNEWLKGKAKEHVLHEFIAPIDFNYDGRGFGTFTVQTDKHRLQISGGYLMNWAILDITK